MSSALLQRLACCVLAFLSIASTGLSQTILFVRSSAPTDGDGTSWARAYQDLQAALSRAESIPLPGRNVEIWIAAGTYRPTLRAGSTSARSERFLIPSNTALFGGFAGTETSRSVRSLDANPTVLTGDLNGDDGPGFANRCDNAVNVVRTVNASGVVLDGLIIQGGYAWTWVTSPCGFSGQPCGTGNIGPALLLESSEVRVRNCVIRDNFVASLGTIWVGDPNCSSVPKTRASDVVISNSAITGNRGKNGVGLFAMSAEQVSVENCTVTQNVAETLGTTGGTSIMWFDHGSATLRNSIIWGNTSASGGDLTTSTGTGSYTIANNCIELSPRSGNGNISVNPQLVSTGGSTAFRLAPGSACIDAGSATGTYPASDIAWNRRVLGARIDMGASEFGEVPYTPVLYVREGLAAGRNDGSDWANAFRGALGLRSALTFAAGAGGAYEQVWIGAGTYKPSVSLTQGGSRSASFVLQDGLALYGGFAGGEASLTQRNISTNVAVLSGDLNSNDSGATNQDVDNSYHVVSAIGVGPSAIMDGLTIRAGSANGGGADDAGGGMRISSASPLVRNCTFDRNLAQIRGGGVAIECASSPRFESCVFSGNFTRALSIATDEGIGAGVSLRGCGADVPNAMFRDCQVLDGRCANGGCGAALTDGATAVFIGTLFRSNQIDQPSFGRGGAVFLNSASTGRFLNTRFLGNVGQSAGAVHAQTATAFVHQCLIWGNSGTYGGIFQAGGVLDVRSSTLSANQSSSGNPVVKVQSAPGSVLVNSIVWGNQPVLANACDLYCQLSTWATTIQAQFPDSGCSLGGPQPPTCFDDPQFSLPLGADGVAGTADDNYRLSGASRASDSGDTNALPLDTYDLDGDGDVNERLPVDLDGNPRFVDNPNASNATPTFPPVDRGCYEVNLSDSRWVGAPGAGGNGSWSTGTHWQNGQSPNANVRAVFGTTVPPPAAYSVSISSSATAYQTQVLANSVTLNLLGGNLTLTSPLLDPTPSLLVTGSPSLDPRLTLRNTGLAPRSLSGGSVVIAAGQGETGRVDIVGPRISLAAVGLTVVGLTGAGVLRVESQGSTDLASVRAGAQTNGSGSIVVTGTGSTLAFGGAGADMILGDAGQGSLSVTAGAQVGTGAPARSLVLGKQIGSDGGLSLSGAGSQFIATIQDLSIGDAGSGLLAISGGASMTTSCLSSAVLARSAGGSASVTIGAGSSWTELSAAISVGGAGAAVVTVEPGGQLTSGIGVTVQATGMVGGGGAINGPVVNIGSIAPGSSVSNATPQTLTINGSYRQLGPVGNDPRSGNLIIDVAGAAPGQADRLVVNGPAEIGGGLVVNFAPGYSPAPGQSVNIPVLSASSLTRSFDVAFYPALTGNRFLRAVYSRAGDVTISSASLNEVLNFGAPPPTGLPDVPTAAAAGDFNGDGRPDLAVAISGGPVASGSVFLFVNTSTGGSITFAAGPTAEVSVGRVPMGVAIGDVDGDGRADLVVSNMLDNTLSVVLQRPAPDPPGTFGAVTQTLPTSMGPTGLCLATLARTPRLDIAVAASQADAIDVYTNGSTPGAPAFIRVPPIPVRPTNQQPGVDRPRSVRPVNPDSDKDLDLAVANPQSGSISIITNTSVPGAFSTAPQPTRIGTGAGTSAVIGGRLGIDSAEDLVCVNTSDSTLSVVLFDRSAGGVMAFRPPVSVPLGLTPVGVVASELAASTSGPRRLDVAVLAFDSSSFGSMRIFRNDTDPLTGQIAFTLVTDAGTLRGGVQPQILIDANARRVPVQQVADYGFDLDADGRKDLVLLARDGVQPRPGPMPPPIPMPGPPSIQVLKPLIACPADFNNSGAVSIQDIFDFLSVWFSQDPRADFNGVGGVSIQDVFDFLTAWFAGCP